MIAEQEAIDCFEETTNKILTDIIGLNPLDVLVTDLTTVLDFSVTQETLNEHLRLIESTYGIDLREKGDFSLLFLCRAIENKRNLWH